MSIDYKSAGVDINAGDEVVERIKKSVKSTFTPNVLADIGGFGSLYDLKLIINKYENPVLVVMILSSKEQNLLHFLIISQTIN